MDSNFQIGKQVVLGEKSVIGFFVCIGTDFEHLSTKIDHSAIIRSHTVIYGGNTIGKNFQAGHGVLIREENYFGNDVSVGSHSVIEHHVKVGNSVRIHTNVFIPEYSILEDNCWIGPNVVFTNSKYPKSKNSKKNLIGPTIKKHAKIGANATILPGIIIGEYALIGAGAVVTKNIPAHAVVAGNPAKLINKIQNLPYV